MRLPQTNRRAPSLAAAFGARAVPHVRYDREPCVLGYERNPQTGRCIKIGGKTYKRLHPHTLPYQNPNQNPNQNLQVQAKAKAKAQVKAKEERRRTSSEGPFKLPVGSAGVAPLADKQTILGWTRAQCDNDRDPLTGTFFATADAASLQDIVRLHDRTCVMSGPLNSKVTAEHKAGQVATIPGDASTHMTLDDFTALRDSMRRRVPGYKIPGRRHQPPPANWQLYIASDNRSGPDFASVLFVDTAKVVHGPAGPQYPVNSVMVDMGFIPLNISDALCAPQLVVDLIYRLATANRLLTPVAGGWKPAAGFPFSKNYWRVPDAKSRFGRLCKDLAKALAMPL